MPNDMLQLTIDKFIFRIPTDLRYSDAGVWVKSEGRQARLGISDFVQQWNGDITFANLVPVGTVVQTGDEVGTIETIKANVSILSPVRGSVIEVNSRLEYEAELINQDPYEKGWLAVIDFGEGAQDMSALLDADAYLEWVRKQAEAELA